MFNTIKDPLLDRLSFTQKIEAARERVIFVLVRIVASLRIIACRNYYEEVDKMFEMSQTCARQYSMGFIDEIIDIFPRTYLSASTEKKYRRILANNFPRKFPGFVRSWGCKNLKQNNCAV